MKRIEEVLEILTENVQQTSYLSWLTIKKEFWLIIYHQ
jgi:hypothetical protein